jgi:molecular chaperone GrpE
VNDAGAPEDRAALYPEPGEEPTADSRQPERPRATGEGEGLPEDADEATEFLLARLRATREEADSHLADLQRVAADYENFRKRAQRERDEIVLRSSQALIQELLPVLDSFDGALASATASGDHQLLAGLRSTYQLLVDVLVRAGLEPIAALGLPFDPTMHEAVSGGGSGHLVVTAEMRRGYALRGRVIRPSLVEVAVATPEVGDSG